ncbi:MAG TPA: sulfotransferase [Candidatus Sulfotelmatobacter sp.]|nr:sulfotransferase [Candidatus Sulfotelmatobacter sp.]
MRHGIHFISGLPRSGSTLLAALLRQNPRFHTRMSGPVAGWFGTMLNEMSGRNEYEVFISDAQRRAVLRGLFEGYYHDVHPHKVVFDTNRSWCTRLPALAELYPDAKVICCVRHVGWIMDSIERLVRRNRFRVSRMFNFDSGGTVYSRIGGLAEPSGLVGFSLNAVREAYYGEQSDRLLLVTYESLSRSPAAVLDAVYGFIGEPPFVHDFDHLAYDEAEFDDRLGMPGLHSVAAKVCHTERQPLLPPDLFARFVNDAFWTDPRLNVRKVKVV